MSLGAVPGLPGVEGDVVTDDEEREANIFAMELLMPEHLVRQEIRLPLDLERDPEIKRLAKLFQVSVQVMTIRLTKLGLIG